MADERVRVGITAGVFIIALLSNTICYVCPKANPVIQKGSGCETPTISEEILHQSIARAINQVIDGKDVFLEALQKNIAGVLNEQQDIRIGGIDSRLEELQKELLRLAGSKREYLEVVYEILLLRERKQVVMVLEVDRLFHRQRLQEMADFLQWQTGMILNYKEGLARRLPLSALR